MPTNDNVPAKKAAKKAAKKKAKAPIAREAGPEAEVIETPPQPRAGWHMAAGTVNSKHVEGLMADGWEPFSAAGDRVYLRKRVV